MQELIEKAIAVHGGLAHWNRVKQVSATFHPSELALQIRGRAAFAKQPTRVTVDTYKQRVTIDPFLGPGHVGLYRPSRTAIMTTEVWLSRSSTIRATASSRTLPRGRHGAQFRETTVNLRRNLSEGRALLIQAICEKV